MKKIIEKILRDIAKVGHFEIDETPSGQKGDIATNIAFLLAKAQNKSPKEVAKKFIVALKKQKDVIDDVAVGGQGFLNITLSENFLIAQAKVILEKNRDFGRSELAKGKKARVEYVSANPTGPLHIGNARGGPLGDVIANVLEYVGFKVLREYIDNDRGNQVLQLGESIVGKGTQYRGEYLKELKRKIGDVQSSEDAGNKAVKILFKEIIDDCRAMGISFDYVVHESELQKKAAQVLDELNNKGFLKEQEGALWFIPGGGDELKAVVRKSDGSYLYFTADIVYHKEKFQSGYDLVVDVFGSNTFGHVPKLKALAKVFGFDLEKFKVVLYQFVRVKRGNQIVKMSKRAGNFVTAREVLDEVGKDAFRFFMLLHDPNTHMDFDLELAKKKSQENPVFYVQYAGVRAKHIIQKSKIKMQNEKSKFKISEPSERKLVLQLIKFSDLVEELAQSLQVHRLTYYAIEVARSFHDFYERLPVIQKGSVNSSRLAIVKATLIVLENTLQLLGVTIPDRM